MMASSQVRTWVHSRLSTDSDLSTITADRVWQQGGILSSQEVKPYLVHHFGNNTDEGMADEDSFQPNRQFLQVFIHCNQGDYGPIDDIMPLVKKALASLEGRPKALIAIQYLETSQDLQDDLLQTYFRYMRFQLILSE
jgi:hypothetical protein